MDRPELIFALIGALGSPLEEVSDNLSRSLAKFGYRSQSIRLIDLIEPCGPPADQGPKRLDSLMSAGSGFRRATGRADALALLAVRRVSQLREQDGGEGATAFILDSLKNPAELTSLRAIYGDRLVALGVHSPRSRRLNLVAEGFVAEGLERDAAVEAAGVLLGRDADEDDDFGQAIDRTFHESDCFIDVDSSGEMSRMRDQLDRTVSIIFGDPSRTPTREERGMFMAAGAAAQSAELTRQVGAAVMRQDGSIISVGCNEVPKSGGGVYWEGDPLDHREFRKGRDSATGARREISEQILEGFCSGGAESSLSPEAISNLEGAIESALSGVTEFGRAAHAEMTALFSAAAAEATVVGATVLSTTFPCHTCTKYLLTAGINRVIYISPYSRSRAAELFPEAIDVEPEPSRREGDVRMRVEPFIGIAPRRYLEYFEFESRRRSQVGEDTSSRDGKVTLLEPSAMRPILSDEPPEEFQPSLPAYLGRERAAVSLTESFVSPANGRVPPLESNRASRYR